MYEEREIALTLAALGHEILCFFGAGELRRKELCCLAEGELNKLQLRCRRAGKAKLTRDDLGYCSLGQVNIISIGAASHANIVVRVHLSCR